MSKIKFNWRTVLLGLALIFLLVYPLLGASSYMRHLFILFFIWAIVAANWNLLMGYAGINSLGNIGFLAIGGYVSGIFAKTFGLSPWLTIPIGGLATCILVTA